MDKHVLVCKDEIENILSGIYRAFEIHKSGILQDNIDIIISRNYEYEQEFFATYEFITTDHGKALKTMEYINKKLGGYIYTDVLRALCHYDSRRGYILFRFLIYCFKHGISAADNLTNEYVVKVLELSRKVSNESHLYNGLVRFKSYNNLLFATIEPKCNVIPLIIFHFSDRFPGENWIIEDKTHNIYAVHKAFGESLLYTGDYQLNIDNDITLYDEYEQLWNVFFDSIAIKERENRRCQQNLLPLWMRKHMNEFNNR